MHTVYLQCLNYIFYKMIMICSHTTLHATLFEVRSHVSMATQCQQQHCEGTRHRDGQNWQNWHPASGHLFLWWRDPRQQGWG